MRSPRRSVARTGLRYTPCDDRSFHPLCTSCTLSRHAMGMVWAARKCLFLHRMQGRVHKRFRHSKAHPLSHKSRGLRISCTHTPSRQRSSRLAALGCSTEPQARRKVGRDRQGTCKQLLGIHGLPTGQGQTVPMDSARALSSWLTYGTSSLLLTKHILVLYLASLYKGKVKQCCGTYQLGKKE